MSVHYIHILYVLVYLLKTNQTCNLAGIHSIHTYVCKTCTILRTWTHLCMKTCAILPAHTSVCAKHVQWGNLLHKSCNLHKHFTNLCSEVMCSLITTLNVQQTRTLVPLYLIPPVCHQRHCLSYSFVFFFYLMMCFVGCVAAISLTGTGDEN